MPAAAARALSPMATRTLLMAITAVQALCKTENRIPDQFRNFRREPGDTAGTSATSPCVTRGSFG